MAAKHNYNTGPLSMYKPTAPLRGSLRMVYSENEMAVAKQDGFTSASYVRSDWPTTAYHKKTGLSKPVGRLENTDEQNAAAVAALGPDWGLDHVPEPEPVAEKKAAEGTGMDIAALLQLGGQIALLTERLSTVEAALIQSEESKTLLASRIGELEAMVIEEPAPAPKVPAAKAVPKEENVPVGAGKK